MKRFSFILFLTIFGSYASAQVPIEVLFSPQSNVDNTTAEVVSIFSVGDTITLIQINILSKEYKKSFIPRVSLSSKIVAGEDSLSIHSFCALKQGTLEPTEDDLQGLHYWTDFKEDEVYSCMATFQGYIKKGINRISIVSGDDEHYSFDGIEIDNPLRDMPPMYHIAYTTAKVNLRERPTVQSRIIGKIRSGAILFLDTLEETDGFYRVHELNASRDGYVSKKYVNLGEIISKLSNGTFQLLRKTGSSESPKAEIFNNTDVVMSLTIGGKQRSFKPRSKKKIVLEPGMLYYMATAPGMNPQFGSQHFKRGDEYIWEFKMISHRF